MDGSIRPNPDMQLVVTSINKLAEQQGQVKERLSSGLRINSSTPDSEATKLTLDSALLAQGEKNLSDTYQAQQIAVDGANALSDIINSLTDLGYIAQNEATSSTQREALDEEAQNLIGDYARITSGTSYNGRNLLDGTGATLRVQTGNNSFNLASDNLDLSLELGASTSSIDLSTQRTAYTSYLLVYSAIDQVSADATTITTTQDRLDRAITLISKNRDINQIAIGKITDINEAQEKAAETRNKILLDANTALFAHSDLTSARVASLLDQAAETGSAVDEKVPKERTLKEQLKAEKKSVFDF